MPTLRLLCPRPVRFRAGCGEFVAMQLKVRHLASLAEAAARARGCAALDIDPDDHDGIRAAYDRQAAGGFDWGSPACNAWVFGTAAGRTAYLRLVLRKTRGMDRAVAAAVAGSLAPREWATLDRIAFAPDPMEELQSLADRAAGVEWPEPPGKGASWGEAVAAAMRRYRRTPPEILGLYLAQFDALIGGDEKAEVGARPDWMGLGQYRAIQRKRRAFWQAGAHSVGGPPPPQPAGDEAGRPAREQ